MEELVKCIELSRKKSAIDKVGKNMRERDCQREL